MSTSISASTPLDAATVRDPSLRGVQPKGLPVAQGLPVAGLGDASARLLGGPPGGERWIDHLARLGPLPKMGPDDITELIKAAGITGRGGGHFELWRKLDLARRSPGSPLVVVNATEGEPASAKDRTLLELRPHLVLDGAAAIASAIGSTTVLVAVHVGSRSAMSTLAAIAERQNHPADAANAVGAQVGFHVVDVPDRYIAGESSSLASFLSGGEALPASKGRRSAESGIDERPTVVSNAETVGHVGLIARNGAAWFREAGSSDGPGSMLVTLAGDVSAPGSVVELMRPATVADLAGWAAGADRNWQAVLLGGYSGSWLSRGRATTTIVRPGRPNDGGASAGCGVFGVIDEDRCGLSEAARLVRWLSDQRAGQCGACSYGLPLVADRMEALAEGRVGGWFTNTRLASLAESLAGRGLCSLPDGTVSMAESALDAFHDEVRLHRRRRCSASSPGGAFPLSRPSEREHWK